MRNRTENVAINVSFSMVGQCVTMLLNFISRTFFIMYLGTEYLGINGLFTNLLTILSFAELGIGNAITFHLYKPLASKNEEDLKKYMKIYEKIYRYIGLFIILVGLCIIPCLEFIIKETPNIKEDIKFIYILFLLNTSISYFYSYKTSIITADQKNYIVTFYTQLIKIIGIVTKIAILVVTKSYVLYLLFEIAFTFLTNFAISRKANKLYPYIKNLRKIPIDKRRLRIIFRDSKSLMIYKIATVVLNGTDNILISALIGVAMVGYTSNYTMVIVAIATIVSQVLDNFIASIGNLNIEKNKEKSKQIFYNVLFISYWIYSYISVMLLILVPDFIGVWLGPKYILSFLVVFGLVLDFYLKGIMNTCVMYRTTNGLFTQTKYSALVAAILNIVLSVLLFKIIGLPGIFIATGISRVFTMGIIDGIVVFKRIFKEKPIEYFFTIIKQFTIFIILFLIQYFIFKDILLGGWIKLIVKAILATVLYNILFIIIYRNKNEFKSFIQILKNMLLNIYTKYKTKKEKETKI